METDDINKGFYITYYNNSSFDVLKESQIINEEGDIEAYYIVMKYKETGNIAVAILEDVENCSNYVCIDLFTDIKADTSVDDEALVKKYLI